MYKNHPFDMNWFVENRHIADKFMSFPTLVSMYLDHEQWRYRFTDTCITVFKVEGGKSRIYCRIPREEHKILWSGKDKPEHSPLVYAIAIKLKYMTFPEIEKISKWFDEDGYKYALKKDSHDCVKVKIKDSYGNSIMIPVHVLKTIYAKSLIVKQEYMCKKSKEYIEWMKVNNPKNLKSNNPFRGGKYKHNNSYTRNETAKKTNFFGKRNDL